MSVATLMTPALAMSEGKVIPEVSAVVDCSDPALDVSGAVGALLEGTAVLGGCDAAEVASPGDELLAQPAAHTAIAAMMATGRRRTRLLRIANAFLK